MQFANAQRKQIEGLVREIREALADGDERLIDEVKNELDDALYDFSRQVKLLTEEEDKGILGTLKDIFIGDDEEYNYRDNYNNRDIYNPYGNPQDTYYDNRGNNYSRGSALPPSYNQEYNPPRDPYGSSPRDQWDENRSNPRNPDRPNRNPPQDQSRPRDYQNEVYTRDDRYPNRQPDNYNPNPRRPPANNPPVDRFRQNDSDYLDDAPEQDRWDEPQTPPPSRRNPDTRPQRPPADRSTSPDSRPSNPRPMPPEQRDARYGNESPSAQRPEVRRSGANDNPPSRRPNNPPIQPVRDEWDDEDEWY
jgi:molecular chaperone DnaK